MLQLYLLQSYGREVTPGARVEEASVVPLTGSWSTHPALANHTQPTTSSLHRLNTTMLATARIVDQMKTSPSPPTHVRRYKSKKSIEMCCPCYTGVVYTQRGKSFEDCWDAGRLYGPGWTGQHQGVQVLAYYCWSVADRHS